MHGRTVKVEEKRLVEIDLCRRGDISHVSPPLSWAT